MKDYEQLYYDLLYKYKKVIKENKELKDVISINNKSDLIKYIVNKTNKNIESRGKYEINR